MFKKIFLPNLAIRYCSSNIPKALRSKKPKSKSLNSQHFLDYKHIRTNGGNGGNGCISFLHLLHNECAGPDGGDGGHGGHVVFKASGNVRDLSHIHSVLQASGGEKGKNKDCHGKNAEHLITEVPIGTVVKNKEGTVVADLSDEGVMFVAARGGAGGKGNHFFTTDTQQSPEICEYGAGGEDLEYSIEIKTMAHMGLIGFPNAGKSTLLRAISRARPKVAPYPFTTLKPELGIITYDDYEQIAVADLPGIIPDSHKNKGLGIQFLRHAERCSGLLFVLDTSEEEPWLHLETLQYELQMFSSKLSHRPQVVIANKMDKAESVQNLEELKKKTDLPVIPISAKIGTNLNELLQVIRVLYNHKT